MHYIQASHKWLMEKETYEFFERSGNIPKPYEVDVPPFYWTHGKDSEFLAKHENGEVFGTYRLAERIDFNDFGVVFLDGASLVSVVSGDKPIITISVVKQGEVKSSHKFESYCKSADFTYTYKDVTHTYSRSYTGHHSRISFAPIIGLHSESFINIRAFCYGFARAHFNIWYREEDLKIQRKVYFLGPWCIIMTDDMKLETVAVIDGCSSFILGIDKVLYTESRFLTKVVTLGKR